MLWMLLKLKLLEVPPDYVSLKNYAVASTSTELSARPALFYIADHLPYKPCNYLNIDEKSE